MSFPDGLRPTGGVAAARWDGRTLELSLETGARLVLSSWAPDLLRVVLAPPGARATIGWALARREGDWPRDFPCRAGEDADGFYLSTPALTARVCRTTGALRVEAQGHPHPVAPDDPHTPSATREQGVWLAKLLRPGQRLLGLGEKTGWLDRRGRRLVMWNTDTLRHLPDTDPLYLSIPFLVVEEAGRFYGLFVHNTHQVTFDLGAKDPDRLLIGVEGGAMDYFVLAGPELHRIVDRYTQLTGRMPLPPRWALGFQQSRWGYQTAAEVEEVAEAFRTRGIPCDVLYLDIDYMDGFRVFTWDARRFPDPSGLIRRLGERGLKVVTIVDPGVKAEEGYPVYDDGVRRGYFCRKADGEPFYGQVWPGKTVWPDFARAEVRRWWAEWHRTLLDAGVSGIWCDMNEPTSFRPPLPPGTLDPSVQHGPDEEQPPDERRPSRHAEAHNVYGMLMSRAAYEAQLRARPRQRPFVLSRSGFAGIQRYAAVWTGDNSSWWEHLAMMIPQLLNLGLSGLPLVGADVGGFSGDCTGELLVRWTQVAAFTPLFRNHSAWDTRRQEVWQFGEEVEAICRRYIELRYRFLPYLYSLAHEAACTGAPIMRPLFWHHPGEPAAYRIQDEFLVGPHLLAAPVTRPGEDHRLVYLPSGEWVHAFRPMRVLGPAHAAVEAPLDEMPLWLRAGAPMPLGPAVPHTGLLRQHAPLIVWVVAPSRAGRGEARTELYEDDGESLAYLDGDFLRRELVLEWDASRAGVTGFALQLRLGPAEGFFRPPRRWVDVVVDRAGGPPAGVWIDGKAAEPAPRPFGPPGLVPEVAFSQEADRAAAPGVWGYDARLDRLTVRLAEGPEARAVTVRWDGREPALAP